MEGGLRQMSVPGGVERVKGGRLVVVVGGFGAGISAGVWVSMDVMRRGWCVWLIVGSMFVERRGYLCVMSDSKVTLLTR